MSFQPTDIKDQKVENTEISSKNDENNLEKSSTSSQDSLVIVPDF